MVSGLRSELPRLQTRRHFPNSACFATTQFPVEVCGMGLPTVQPRCIAIAVHLVMLPTHIYHSPCLFQGLPHMILVIRRSAHCKVQIPSMQLVFIFLPFSCSLIGQYQQLRALLVLSQTLSFFLNTHNPNIW